MIRMHFVELKSTFAWLQDAKLRRLHKLYTQCPVYAHKDLPTTSEKELKYNYLIDS